MRCLPTCTGCIELVAPGAFPEFNFTAQDIDLEDDDLEFRQVLQLFDFVNICEHVESHRPGVVPFFSSLTGGRCVKPSITASPHLIALRFAPCGVLLS